MTMMVRENFIIYNNAKGHPLYFLICVFPGPALTMIFDCLFFCALKGVLGFEMKGSVTQQAGATDELG